MCKSHQRTSDAKRERALLTGPLRDVCSVPKIVPLAQHSVNKVVYQYIEGSPLYTRYPLLRSNLRERLRLFRSLLITVHQIHEQGLVHNDLSPGNILVDQANNVSVIDFGNTTQAQCSSYFAIGKPHYATPEQLAKKPADIASDIYQLGCILFEMEQGHQYQSAQNQPQVTLDRINTSPAAPLLRQMLAPDPGNRPTSASECCKTIDNLISLNLV